MNGRSPIQKPMSSQASTKYRPIKASRSGRTQRQYVDRGWAMRQMRRKWRHVAKAQDKDLLLMEKVIYWDMSVDDYSFRDADFTNHIVSIGDAVRI
jgi:hypothetical protein